MRRDQIVFTRHHLPTDRPVFDAVWPHPGGPRTENSISAAIRCPAVRLMIDWEMAETADRMGVDRAEAVICWLRSCGLRNPPFPELVRL